MTTSGALATFAKGALAEVVELWDWMQRKMNRWLTAEMLANAWIAGLAAAGVKAEHGKVWVRGSKYPVKSPFVIEFACPMGHRTEDKRFYATVQLLVEDDGWVSLDVDSQCPDCTIHALERWLLTCPRCEAGDTSPEHLDADAPYDDEHPLHQGHYSDGSVIGSTAPLAYVLTELQSLRLVAEAQWWVNHTEDATEWWRQVVARIGASGAYASPAVQLELARHTLERDVARRGRSLPITGSPTRTSQDSEGQRSIEWTDESAADWLDALSAPDVPSKSTVRAVWALVKDLPGRPPKNRVESAQTLRKSRTGSER